MPVACTAFSTRAATTFGHTQNCLVCDAARKEAARQRAEIALRRARVRRTGRDTKVASHAKVLYDKQLWVKVHHPQTFAKRAPEADDDPDLPLTGGASSSTQRVPMTQPMQMRWW